LFLGVPYLAISKRYGDALTGVAFATKRWRRAAVNCPEHAGGDDWPASVAALGYWHRGSPGVALRFVPGAADLPIPSLPSL